MIAYLVVYEIVVTLGGIDDLAFIRKLNTVFKEMCLGVKLTMGTMW